MLKYIGIATVAIVAMSCHNYVNAAPILEAVVSPFISAAIDKGNTMAHHAFGSRTDKERKEHNMNNYGVDSTTSDSSAAEDQAHDFVPKFADKKDHSLAKRSGIFNKNAKNTANENDPRKSSSSSSDDEQNV